MLRELGLGMLFLLAGYELEPAELTGRGGRRALVAWCVCLVLAVGLVFLLDSPTRSTASSPWRSRSPRPRSAPCCRSSRTAACSARRSGKSLMNHGAYGELGPIVAMAVLLSTRGPLESLARCWSASPWSRCW